MTLRSFPAFHTNLNNVCSIDWNASLFFEGVIDCLTDCLIDRCWLSRRRPRGRVWSSCRALRQLSSYSRLWIKWPASIPPYRRSICTTRTRCVCVYGSVLHTTPLKTIFHTETQRLCFRIMYIGVWVRVYAFACVWSCVCVWACVCVQVKQTQSVLEESSVLAELQGVRSQLVKSEEGRRAIQTQLEDAQSSVTMLQRAGIGVGTRKILFLFPTRQFQWSVWPCVVLCTWQ